MAVYADRVQENTATTGTGTYSLGGAATGFQTFVTGVGSGNVVTYECTDGTNWETGEGTVTTGTPATLTRTTILSSSNSGSAVSWSAGTKTIFLTLAASRAVTSENTATLTNKTLQSPYEKITSSATAATGTIAYDAVTQAVLYYTTNSSANFTLNVRGNSTTTLASLMSVGQSATVVFMNTNGASPFVLSAVQIDGTTTGVTTKWQGGTAPSAGNASAIDVYSLTIIKTAATPTYTVLGSMTKFA